jgi:phytoene synthase
LERFMPSLQSQPSSGGPFADAADRAACREMIRTGSRSFHAASLLLPEAMREAAYALYGFCRLSDDAVDEGTAREAALAQLARRLDAAYAGRPFPAAPDRCLADTVRRHAIPKACFDALLEGFAWDLEGKSHRTLADVEAYAERVAGSVGAMMAALMGARAPAMVERACDLGVAMQLTNIARDVGEDARNGRLYLPLDWLEEAGIDPAAFLAAPVFTPALGKIVRRLLARAGHLYRQADPAIARLPAVMRPAIHAARLLYAEIGAAVAANGHDSVGARATTTPARKGWLVGRALQRAVRPAPVTPLVEHEGRARPLVAAVADEPLPPVAVARRPSVADDVNWVVDLFADLDGREWSRARLAPPR